MKQRGKFCAEDSDSILEGPGVFSWIHKAEYSEEKVSRILIIPSCSHCHLLMFLDSFQTRWQETDWVYKMLLFSD